MTQVLFFIDRISTWTGKAFAWCILLLTFAVSYEVFMRYVVRDPTAWAFDVSYMMYGALFMMGGAYTLSRDGHVRGDFVYRLWPPRVQASISFVLYFLFFFPGALALIYAGWDYAWLAIKFRERSIWSPAGMPIYHFKALIPIAGFFLVLQGIAETIRCVICLRDGQWPQRLHDVEEMETAILHEQEHLAQLAAETKGEAAGGAR